VAIIIYVVALRTWAPCPVVAWFPCETIKPMAWCHSHRRATNTYINSRAPQHAGHFLVLILDHNTNKYGRCCSKHSNAPNSQHVPSCAVHALMCTLWHVGVELHGAPPPGTRPPSTMPPGTRVLFAPLCVPPTCAERMHSLTGLDAMRPPGGSCPRASAAPPAPWCGCT
jgi:hypothetical protein